MKTDDIAATIERALRSAGLNTATPLVEGIRHQIRSALASAGLASAAGGRAGDVIDVEARERPDPEWDDDARQHRPEPPAAESGSFTWQRHEGSAGNRRFKTYVASSYRGGEVPLIVMLHGCRQDPDDFAAGTRMNRMAEQHGFIVAYPQQPARANGSSCWNWFEPRDQRREGGEPELIAGIVQQIVAQGQVDPHRVFVAGLSAGAAMALILSRTHPDVFAGIGVHSGMPYAAAHDVASAFAAMSGGGARRSGAAPSAHGLNHRALPTIVFHGEQDGTVRVGNADRIVAEALHAFEAHHGRPLHRVASDRGNAGGREFVRARYADIGADTLVQLEDWRISGAGHAWSGGSNAGSFADAQGPDASAAMVDFFLRPRSR